MERGVRCQMSSDIVMPILLGALQSSGVVSDKLAGRTDILVGVVGFIAD